MTQAGDIPQRRPLARIGAFVAERRGLVRDYLSAISGAGGRLVFSLAYFIALANTLSIAEFGMFATASAAGVMLSRVLAFGFISALYRTATIRPNLIGTFTAGFLLLGVISLPLLAAASYGVYLVFFASTVPLSVFAAIVFAEALLWRPVEVALIVNNGLGKFGRAALLTILATALRALGAVLFMFASQPTIGVWSWYYIGANAASLLLAFAFFYPRQRLRLRLALYIRRLADSIYVAGAEMMFYLQMEFDKLLVLAIGGPHLAGIYAIIMRLVDLTAIPIRTFSMMLVQRMMRAPELLSRLTVKSGIEGGVFLVSTLALAALAIVLHFFPNALGKNVAEAAPLVALGICVPGLRNLIEYQAELLFARGQTLVRAINLALLAGLKAVLLTYVLTTILDTPDLVLSLNVVFLLLYLASTLLTYSAMRKPAKPV
ncbi:MAG: lipopolysaccharide biosynthesis protein [Mesorhizobium sp.]|uniref:lipopolysaccharide biosynthesis protein n=1 Tax=unclassified Mesorhizobium TaxID=325217 RepID=UPI000FD4B843|nr:MULTISPECIES: lipopolysaccharide biosynthesis protein [unclassified Mesorhizobium]RUV86115.1 lipopolysaccharide biosynthesis protein [Mesorhizobium sp. M5C.F.Ca.IN.020.14.1.1]RUV29577.1 lipopolysaccharide biosynthesis protein [Mesorhizobium sp. M5C.F.Ca.IN.020.32.2.1]RWE11307.1 MAG: lipopolysaccharide biosynthesis protein [Mesorhizobium sp.]RWG46122.1 MAG: lipopolysaccharide biosynthesis protein [Mesorhizobium sp.]RWH48924.1 MAG: lipopolysaccharide biosynthesis protein [Mesorhizobium sp.]